MKKYIIGTTACLILLMFFVSAFVYRVEVATAIGSILRSGANVSTGTLKMRTSDATTSPEFIVAGLATSTLTFASENFSSAGIELQVFASSTNLSSIQIERLASDDNINFYAYEVASTSNFLVYNPTEGATSTTYFDIGLLPARYTRLNIGISTTTSGAAAKKDRANIWANVVGEIK